MSGAGGVMDWFDAIPDDAQTVDVTLVADAGRFLAVPRNRLILLDDGLVIVHRDGGGVWIPKSRIESLDWPPQKAGLG